MDLKELAQKEREVTMRYQRARIMQLIKDVAENPQIPEDSIRDIVTEILETKIEKVVRIIDKHGKISDTNFKTREIAEDYIKNLGLDNGDYFIVEPFGDIRNV